MDIEKVKKQLERIQAKQREEARKAQALGAKISSAERARDTRRKILAGSWVLERAERTDDFRAMLMRELDRVWLSRDDDRALFGFPPLSEEEKARREVVSAKPARKKATIPDGEKAEAKADAADAA